MSWFGLSTRILKFRTGQNVLKELEKFGEKNNIEHGFIISGFGKVKNFRLSSFAGAGKIEDFESNTPADLTSISGEIKKTGKGMQAFVRVSLKRPGLNAVSGVLLDGKASGELEIEVRKANIGKIIEA